MSSDVPVHDGASIPRICIAKIATAHGIKGLVKLHVFAEDIGLFKNDLFTSETGEETIDLTPKNSAGKYWIAEIKDIIDRTQAEKFRGTEIYINQDVLPEAEEGEFYIADLIGMTCVDRNTKEIGKVIAVENFGAGDLLDIQPSGMDSFYLPFNDDTILEILEDQIIVEIPEGLLE